MVIDMKFMHNKTRAFLKNKSINFSQKCKQTKKWKAGEILVFDLCFVTFWFIYIYFIRNDSSLTKSYIEMEKFDEAVKFACKHFGIERLYDEQLECVRQFFLEKNVFCSVPTGFGKSLIYQVLPLMHDYMFETHQDKPSYSTVTIRGFTIDSPYY